MYGRQRIAFMVDGELEFFARACALLTAFSKTRSSSSDADAEESDDESDFSFVLLVGATALGLFPFCGFLGVLGILARGFVVVVVKTTGTKLGVFGAG
jgi:hypothetical protein